MVEAVHFVGLICTPVSPVTEGAEATPVEQTLHDDREFASTLISALRRSSLGHDWLRFSSTVAVVLPDSACSALAKVINRGKAAGQREPDD